MVGKRATLKGGQGGLTANQARLLNKTWKPPKPGQLRAFVFQARLQIEEFKLGKIIGSGTFSYVRMVHLRNTDETPPPMALKTMKKKTLVDLGQVGHVQAERTILGMLNFPFIVVFLGSFQDDRRVFFLMEYMHGGDLYGRLKREGRLPVDHAKFYAAELVLAFDYLHSLGVAYRDLKPENVMLDRDGHLRLIDFGFAKVVKSDMTFTIVGTPEYLAPEIIQSIGHNTPVDMWALGVLIYEMLAGYPPFFAGNPYDIYKKILGMEIKYPRHFDVKARDLIQQLLAHSARKRFTCENCFTHTWFNYVEWMSVLGLDVVPPFRPHVESPDDTRLFETIPEDNGAPDSFDATQPIKKDKNRLFIDNF